MEIYSVNISAETVEKLRALEPEDLDLKTRAARQESPTRYLVPGLVTKEQLEKLVAAGYQVEIVADLSLVAPERLAEVSRVNRFTDARGIIDFEGCTVLGYLTADEVEAALINLQLIHPDLVTLLPLPFTTWEGRTSRAVRVRAGTKVNRVGVLFTGSIHAREWGGSDILLNLLVRLISAYRTNSALSFGSKSFSAAQVKVILENLDLFVFPDVNPDGKQFSQTTNPGSGSSQGTWWRKNRNPNTATGGIAHGVDLNRNFDFLWGSGIGTSTSPSSFTYKGTAPFSEPEVRNIKHLFETFDQIQYYVDVHSHGQLILYNWGDDNNQNAITAQNFLNPAFNGQRGTPGDALYREFIPTLDENTAINLAQRMKTALQMVRGKSYTVQQSVGLYPTSATSDDYAFGRHLVDALKNKVYAYTVEFGQEFVPPFAEMSNIINDVGAALTELCWAANSEVCLRDTPLDVGAVPSTGAFWNSPDIWIRNVNDGGTVHQNTIRGRDNFIYVRVRNRGLAEATDVKVRIYLVTFAGTEFVFPQSYVARNPAGGGTIAGPGTYFIGQVQIPVLAAGATQTVNLPWPAALIPPAAGFHPCLLAEVAPNDSRSSGNHVWDSNNLAQKNLTIINARRGEWVEYSFQVGNAFSPAKAGGLVLHKSRLPETAGAFLDVKDAAWLAKLKPLLPKINQPVREPLASAATIATMLRPTTIALPIHDQRQDESWIISLPIGARMERQRSLSSSLEITRAEQLAGLHLVTLNQRPFLKLAGQAMSKLPLVLKAGEVKPMSLNVSVPANAVTGDSYEFDVVQQDAHHRIIGGVTLEIRIVA